MDIQAIKARVNEALEKGWMWSSNGEFIPEDDKDISILCHPDFDLPFIASAPSDIDALVTAYEAKCARVEELEAENTRLIMSETRIRSDARSDAILDTRRYLAEGLRKLNIEADDKISLTDILHIVSRFIDNVGDLYERVEELEAE